ncbi:PIG-L deacetylase family protein [Isoptericola croceus]|uniref:PIG-L deacetylase family protein n=1 Tax=Isoptericola croceus TaxID=3031406 RepID=UPI0023F8719E|nr:PIG-L family deacetylase [Isoptericola croceus]
MIPLSLGGADLRVVCLAAHPDDVEIACGGTLLSFAERSGVTADFLTLTGDPAREAEAASAAEAFLPGSSSTFAGLPDGRLPEYWGATKSALHEHAERHPSPHVVLAPRSDDAHQDHRLVGEMAPTVWRDALVLHYEIPKWDGDMGRPTTYVPVPEDRARRKVELLDEHYPSQCGHDWWDPEVFLGLMRLRGMECRERYAEAFVVRKAIVRW